MAKVDQGADYLSAGIQFVKKGELKDALKSFEKGEHWQEAGKVAQRLKKTSKAIDLFLRAGLFSDVAIVYLETEQFLKAADYFEAITKRNSLVLED